VNALFVMSSDRSPARSFRDLRVWQKAHEFVLAVYHYTESFPEREKYGLTHQLRHAAVSIPANIAEGFGKRRPAEKARFLNIAEGSVEECRYYLILSQDLGYGQSESPTTSLEETSKLLNAYIRAVLASGYLTSRFYILKGYQGRSPWLVRSSDL
jgi:four helix bundle protein